MDKDALVRGTKPPRTEQVPTSEGPVTVRGLSRYELHLSGKGTEDSGLIEARMIQYALIDPAGMTVADVRAWQRRPETAGEMQRVAEMVRDLSGLAEGAGKSALSGDGGGPVD